VTHALCLVVIPGDTEDVEGAVAAAMEPYNENVNDAGWWDWWQIGGRYSGAFSEYDPRTDQRNWEECLLCRGTGIRNDSIAQAHRRENPDYTCNGCSYHQPEGIPTGWRVKWPSDWAPVRSNVMKVADWLTLPEDRRNCFAVVIPEVGGHEREIYVPDASDGKHFPDNPAFPDTYAAIGRFPDALIVAVDYHS